MKKYQSRVKEDFELNISATPENIDITATGDEAKELEEFTRCVLGDNCDFFNTEFDKESDMADEENSDEPEVAAVDIVEPDEVVDEELTPEEQAEKKAIEGPMGVIKSSDRNRYKDLLNKEQEPSTTGKQLNEDDWSDLWDDVPSKGLVDPDVDEGLLLPDLKLNANLSDFGGTGNDVNVLEGKACCKEALNKNADMYDQVSDELYAAGNPGRRGGVDGKGHQIAVEGTERRYEADEIGIDPMDEEDNIKITVENPDDLSFAVKVANFFKVPYKMGSNWIKIYYYGKAVEESLLGSNVDINLDAHNFGGDNNVVDILGGKNLSECDLSEDTADLTDDEFIEAYKKIKASRHIR